MWLRGATSSLLVSFLFAFAYLWFIENKSFSQAFQENLIFLALFFFLGIYTSSMIIVYGKQIKRRIRREKGQIKWFDPSKGYGFVERDKGGDLFIHFASVEIQDRKLLKESTRVSFVVTDGLKGPQAKDIKII